MLFCPEKKITLPFVYHLTHSAIAFPFQQIRRAIQMTGFRRQKRGFTRLVIGPENLELDREPNDPYFPFQWYLVSGLQLSRHLSI